jgi:hypothetical protein
MRSTVSMPNMLKPNGASLLENAFWQSMSTTVSSWLRGCTYRCRNKWLFLQKVFHYHAINHIAILIYLLACSINTITQFHIVDLGESLVLCWILMHFHVGNNPMVWDNGDKGTNWDYECWLWEFYEKFKL